MLLDINPLLKAKAEFYIYKYSLGMIHIHYGIWENLENSMGLLLGLSEILNIKNIRNHGHILNTL